jgi:hypothetical protein
MTWWKNRNNRLNDEIQAHIDFEIEENVEAGMLPDEARDAAMRKFGNVLLARERSREIWGWLWAERLLQDIRYALRGLLRNLGFSAVAILSLALGIGATTSMFSVIYAVLLHPAPYADWQRLAYPIYLNDDQPTSPQRWFSLTWPQYQQLLKADCVEDALGDDNTTSEITGNGIPEDVTLTYITENASSFLRVPALLGRDIQPSDSEAADRQALVVLSYDLWMRHYNGDRNVLGKTFELDHKPYAIVGVMPKD